MTKTANPAPLGLAAFGMTTVLLNIHNAGILPLSATIVAMGLFYGGLAQVMVGYMCYKNGDTFSTTSFTSYGFFWISLVAIWTMPTLGIAKAADHGSLGVYLGMWGLFSLFLFFGTFKYSLIKQIVFGSLVILFALLSLHHLLDSEILGIIAGYEGIFCGLSALYMAMGQVLNETFGKTVMPLG